ncbi:hypothetical protein [Shouchella clausii]|uniref:hypothetical protein n=1 Tax=Shouchella clausii TaxID=79880 RepID=UPI0015952505|nr:hypothetical protein [Shouchella clausii]
MSLKYYRCTNCPSTQVETEFGECMECGYEDLVEITKNEYDQINNESKKSNE